MKYLIAFVICVSVAAAADAAVVFKAQGLRWDERCAAEALAGLLNRDGANVYLDFGSSRDQKWLDIYRERNGLTYTHLDGLRTFLDRYSDAAKGLIVYDPEVDGSRYVAITLAGVEDLLPVSPAMLNGASPGLLAEGQWPGVDFASLPAQNLSYWSRAAGPKLDLQAGRGLSMQEGNPEEGQSWSFSSYGPITIDLGEYPILEVDVSDLRGEGAHWMIKLTWDRDSSGWIGGHADDLVLPSQGEAGVHTWNIAELADIHSEHTFAKIQLHVGGEDATVIWRRVRFISEDGASPPQPAARALTSPGLEVKRDLRGRFEDSVAAYDWALDEVMPHCNRRFAHAVNGIVEGVKAGGGAGMGGFDWPVMNRGFIFNLTCAPEEMRSYGGSRVGGSSEQAEMYRRILEALEPPAQITGYGEPEGYWCSLLSQNGHYSFHYGNNWSFHSQVPIERQRFRQRVRFTPENTEPEPDKYYVCFMTSEGDTMKGPVPFFFGSWFEDERGRTPMNWGINPLMAEQFPAMLDYYYDTATPNDYFFCGVSGAGYCYPDEMPNLEQFARHTRVACQKADTLCIDAWGMSERAVLETYARITDPLGLTINRSPARMQMLPDGTPVAYHELAYWQQAVLPEEAGRWSNAFEDDDVRSEAIGKLVDQIENIARRHYPPFIILVYGDLHSYAHHNQLHGEIAAALDGDRFKPARLDEAMAAMRAWAQQRVLIGADSINERLVWAVLRDTPTTVPLTVTNTSGDAKPVQVAVEAGPLNVSRELTLAANETREVTDLELNASERELPAASVSVTAAGQSIERSAEMIVVPVERAPEAARLAGVWGAVGLRHSGGKTVEAADALNGQAWLTPEPGADMGHVLFGPYADLPQGRYLVAFRVRLREGTAAGDLAPDDTVITLDVNAGGYDGLGKAVAKRDITADELGADGEWQWFTLPVDWPGPPSLMETRIWWESNAQLLIDRVAVFELEADAQ